MVAGLFPEIEPFEVGHLDVGEGNSVYWEICGSPDGKPALVVHGGPGSGCTPTHRRFFDPSSYRIVLFDQRGSGRSTPHAGDIDTSLEHNTTAHLVRDMEALRSHLGIHQLHDIPAVLIHGQLDHSTAITTARELADAWPDSELVVVDAGHLANEPAMVEAAVDATN